MTETIIIAQRGTKDTLFNFYHNYYHFHDPSTLLMEINTMSILFQDVDCDHEQNKG